MGRVTRVLLVVCILIPASGCAPAVVGESDERQARQFVVNAPLREERLIPVPVYFPDMTLKPAREVRVDDALPYRDGLLDPIAAER